MSLKHVKEYTDTLPQNLLQSLKGANVIDTEPTCIEKKLQERTSSQIVSYLQLALIKLRHNSVAARDFSTKMTAHTERISFGALLRQHVHDLKDQ
jgi:hypothetical protein